MAASVALFFKLRRHIVNLGHILGLVPLASANAFSSSVYPRAQLGGSALYISYLSQRSQMDGRRHPNVSGRFFAS